MRKIGDGVNNVTYTEVRERLKGKGADSKLSAFSHRISRWRAFEEQYFSEDISTMIFFQTDMNKNEKFHHLF